MKNRVFSSVGFVEFCASGFVVLTLVTTGIGKGHAQPSPVPLGDVWRPDGPVLAVVVDGDTADRKSTRLNSSHRL